MNHVEIDNVVLIDVDTYNSNNVIIIDTPEIHSKKKGGSSDKNRPLRTYIYIDDDESPCNNNAGASSSKRYGSENVSPVTLSKGKRTYSGRGLNTQSDSDSSDDDGPDCEFMEDFSGKLREQWEKASLKRKAGVHNDHMSSSRPFRDAHCEFGVNKNKKKHVQDSNINGTVDEKEGESSNCDNSIIDQREKLKETNEYKRALEEELSARQKALQIQAEEAQQLRRLQKRKKAECLRLLDMERRQKQRVEEIRETQKKDEENMNLKEQYRTEVRETLKKLEITCLDMTSLLHGLGIQVGNGPFPLSHEVRAAYKRALLSFHPDRASGSDMRQQVEAEEKKTENSKLDKIPTPNGCDAIVNVSIRGVDEAVYEGGHEANHGRNRDQQVVPLLVNDGIPDNEVRERFAGRQVVPLLVNDGIRAR
ncbi:hypothetical protein E3N88_01885 [Mikania micrantha]|uniref:J domain-containing protein n=1 Tax=Mikania micrantha TaxID=192012 RepID=A0A5N6Q2D6_9ASTR|nr:hypothetical protein E3N88_01885 [Mikania micrantha]